MGCPYLIENTLRLRHKPNKLMLSIGLWRWYINITIRILDIIHRPVLYLKLSSTLGCPYLIENTLRLRHKPNKLMLSIGLWRWYINITIAIMDIIHRLHLELLSWEQEKELVYASGPAQRLSPSIGPNWISFTWRRRQNPVSEMPF
jgi:hypothetical protein